MKKNIIEKEILKINKKNIEKFSKIENKKRIVFVPQCLRNSKKCKAKEEGGLYICANCGACKISSIVKAAKELGYQGVYILKGGSILPRILKQKKFQGALGIACPFEGLAGLKKSLELNIYSVCVPLSKDGCIDTDISLEKVLKVMKI